MTTWRSIAKKRGKLRKIITSFIYKKFKYKETLRNKDKERLDKGEITLEEYKDLIEKEHADAFTLKEIMDYLGLDYEKRSDYRKVYQALADERKDIEKYFELFLKSEEFQKAKSQGKSDDYIWGDFITAANSWNIYLLYCDDDGRYKQIDLFSYVKLINHRLLAMDRELRTKGEQIRLIGKVLPTLIPHLKPPELDGFKDRHHLLVAHPWTCPYCMCDFSDENELKNHLNICSKKV